MYLFGEDFIFNGSEADCEQVILEARLSCGHKPPRISEIINVIDKLSIEWREGGEFFSKALVELSLEGHFSEEMNGLSLKMLPSLFSKTEVLKRLQGEFENPKALDEFVNSKNFQGAIKYEPLGCILHITASNVFLGAIDSLLMALITKNISIVKLGQKNLTFPNLFLESLKKVDPDKILLKRICFLSWRGGSEPIEKIFKQKMDGIIIWGGEDAVNSYRQGTSAGTKIIEHGARVSFQVLSLKYFKQMQGEDFSKLARDICIWDQSACANAQCLYIEEGIDKELLLKNLELAFDMFEIPRRELNLDENLEKYGAIEQAHFNKFQGSGDYFQGSDYLIEFSAHNLLSSSTLNRHLLIKSYSDLEDLTNAIEAFKKFLQSCALGCDLSERGKYLRLLTHAGVKRITSFGSMLQGIPGAPHDGRLDLLELVNLISLEGDLAGELSPQEFALKMCQDVPYYKRLNITKFEHIPFADSKLYRDFGPNKGDELLNINREAGILFSSGGTSGAPKYCFFENREFSTIAKTLGDSYIDLGLNRSDVVGNLFTAGNMWSSFSIIQKALENTTDLQLPMGASINIDEFSHLVKTFKINVVFGLPSLLCDIARKTQGLRVEKIFYAGEPMRDSYKKILSESWGCLDFYSAGYAGVDIGPIGYQDSSCKGTEHVLFEELVFLEVIDEEAVVTSKVRSGMPVLRYKTGDRVEIIEKAKGRTKFKLLGRTDSLINIWSSRISLQDILAQFSLNKGELQVIVESGAAFDIMVFNTDTQLSPQEREVFLENVFKSANDLRQTHTFDGFKKRCDFRTLEIIRSEKTGKIKYLVDLR